MTNRILAGAIALCMVLPATLSAQDAVVVQSLKGIHDITAGYIKSTAEMLDEELYSYRPTEEVRSVGEILGHVANAQYLFCSAAAGEESPNSRDFEEVGTNKAEINAALEDAFAYCADVYAEMNDAEGAETVQFFGQQRAKSAVLAFNTTHNYEHYGNLVTYMRLNGITPPSSM